MITPPVLFVLDVGHGSCAVLCDTKGVVVIDAGPRTTLLEFLRSEGIDRIDTVLISHADEDHIAGLLSLLESKMVKIGRVRLNPDLAKDTKAWRDLNWLLDKGHCLGEIDFDTSLTTRHSGDFDCGEIHIEILAPSMFAVATSASPSGRSRRLDSNSRSVVVRLARDGQALVLLAGDIDDVGFEALLHDHSAPRAPVLVYPHHGGRSGATSEIDFASKLCRAIVPSSVIFSIGRGKHDTPRPEIVETVRRELPGVRIACTQLSEHC